MNKTVTLSSQQYHTRSKAINVPRWLEGVAVFHDATWQHPFESHKTCPPPVIQDSTPGEAPDYMLLPDCEQDREGPHAQGAYSLGRVANDK